MWAKGLLLVNLYQNVHVDALLPQHLQLVSQQNARIWATQRLAVVWLQKMLDLKLQIGRKIAEMMDDDQRMWYMIGIIMIIACVISLLCLAAKGIQISPFSRTLYTPVNMYRSRQVLIQAPILQLWVALPMHLVSTIQPLLGTLRLRFFTLSLEWPSHTIWPFSSTLFRKVWPLSMRRLHSIVLWKQWVFVS